MHAEIKIYHWQFVLRNQTSPKARQLQPFQIGYPLCITI